MELDFFLISKYHQTMNTHFNKKFIFFLFYCLLFQNLESDSELIPLFFPVDSTDLIRDGRFEGVKRNSR